MTINKITGMFLLFGFAASTVQADTLLTTREGTLGPGGDTDGSTVSFWSRSDWMARIDENGKMIYDLEGGVTYMVNDQNKSCFALTKQEIGGGAGIAGQVEVRETNETRQIGPWQAKGYDLTVTTESGPMEISVWVSEDVPANVGGQRAYTESIVTPDSAWLLELFDLGGYPVRQEVSMGPVSMWAELISIEEKSAPSGTYDIPAGYSGCD